MIGVAGCYPFGEQVAAFLPRYVRLCCEWVGPNCACADGDCEFEEGAAADGRQDRPFYFGPETSGSKIAGGGFVFKKGWDFPLGRSCFFLGGVWVFLQGVLGKVGGRSWFFDGEFVVNSW